uniref:Uncharacterized protein n=1 Tax=Favella ehrenbergii TaxID=182087 RepID=A0A7S3MRA5_9SPIT
MHRGLTMGLVARLLVLLLQKQELLSLHVLHLGLLLAISYCARGRQGLLHAAVRILRVSHVLHADWWVCHELACCQLVVLQDLVHKFLLFGTRDCGCSYLGVRFSRAMIVDR